MTYTWRHIQTGIKIEVERKMSESDVPPQSHELAKQGLIEPEFQDTNNWKKVITGGSFTKGFGQKGAW